MGTSTKTQTQSIYPFSFLPASQHRTSSPFPVLNFAVIYCHFIKLIKIIIKMQSKTHLHKQSEQLKKMFCAYHRTQFLTNFCVDKNCLMPLCPSCIVDHTDEHYKQSSRPLYMNIHDALYSVKQSCLGHIHEFQDHAEKLVNYDETQKQMSQFKRKLVQEVHTQLLEHKQNICSYIDRLFIQYEHEIYNFVATGYENEGLYREDDINEYTMKVHQVINQLYDKIGLIKGEQCLGSLIVFFGEEKERFSDILGECEEFIDRHDVAKIDTLLDEVALKNQLHNLFENTIEIKKIDFGNHQNYEPIGNRTPQKYANNSNSKLSHSRKSRIFNHSDSKYSSPPKHFDQSIRKQKIGNKSNLR